jgi:hypothetical protein
MKKLALILCIVLVIGIFFLWKHTSSKVSTPTTNQKTPTEKTITVKEIGLTMTVPFLYSFAKEHAMNYTTNKPYGITFTIQNYVHTFDEVKDPYQLYGFVQWDTDKMSVQEFKKADFDITPSTRKEFVVDGLPVVAGVASGKRPRYFVNILLKSGYVLKLAASGLVTDYKQHTDILVQQMKFE